MIVYLDNDALLKVVAWNLLDETLALLGATRSDVFIHSDARYVLPPKCRKPGHGGEATKLRLESAIAELACILDVPDRYAELVAEPGIDPGEALLIGHAASSQGAFLTTGDKKALRALAAPSLREICDSLAGRVVCVETAVEALIHRLGFEQVRDSILPALGCDKVIQVAFGRRELTTEADALDALRYYTDVPPGLLFRVPACP